nr:hypothetical protein [Streptomyces samsunensis]
MGAERIAYLFVDALEAVVQGQDLGSEVGGDLRRDLFTGQGGLLGLRLRWGCRGRR